MEPGTKKLVMYGGGALALGVAYAIGVAHGRRRSRCAQYAMGPAAAPITPTLTPPVTTVGATSTPTNVSLALAPGVMTVSVPHGSTLSVFPADANSKLLTFSTAGGTVTSATSASGPQIFTINGSGAIVLSWQDATGGGVSTTVNVTAT